MKQRVEFKIIAIGEGGANIAIQSRLDDMVRQLAPWYTVISTEVQYETIPEIQSEALQDLSVSTRLD